MVEDDRKMAKAPPLGPPTPAPIMAPLATSCFASLASPRFTVQKRRVLMAYPKCGKVLKIITLRVKQEPEQIQKPLKAAIKYLVLIPTPSNGSSGVSRSSVTSINTSRIQSSKKYHQGVIRRDIEQEAFGYSFQGAIMIDGDPEGIISNSPSGKDLRTRVKPQFSDDLLFSCSQYPVDAGWSKWKRGSCE
ncbi:hypothetical protein BX616_010954 [Lobosporangium transversale]|uniref:Uncharacterized protein n=1 Tax=Lobosporangium transversale TaxID=64571 RepID=A0A1Y2GER9_9FUNG|nr:hypothetical protein BCR41DRAFT_400440 [Lobosporangium transversale]KAF9919219.1 hypothetical protein BX616_010954 [Lobosporangium transversale]ORZ05694.1 hypothetical protein BCR41DRAFT_400440 [Lobosporangium transversale]|eukprot:XP_021877181.1 hypothetical protein BCR41DRAFT_400440 [Lobosporangium transversale]